MAKITFINVKPSLTTRYDHKMILRYDVPMSFYNRNHIILHSLLNFRGKSKEILITCKSMNAEAVR